MSHQSSILILLFFLLISLLSLSYCFSLFNNPSATTKEEEFPSQYGVDVTFPIHGPINPHSHPTYSKRYQDYLEGCYHQYSKTECDQYEQDRIAMNRQQPALQHNYTNIGFLKTKLPRQAWDALSSFYERNKDDQHEKEEVWPRGNTYVNHWQHATGMISFEDTTLRGGLMVKQLLCDAMQPIIEEWVGQKVIPTSLYGIRLYKNGNVLATHVDRLPLVSSAIIQVAQDVEEDWPIEVYDHAGQAHNVSMKPGDVVLYESHTVLHGRPFPLKGKFYANVFVHFKPVDHDKINKEERDHIAQEKKETEASSSSSSSSSFFSSLFSSREKNRKEKSVGGHEASNHHHHDQNQNPRRYQNHAEQAFRRNFEYPEEDKNQAQQHDPSTNTTEEEEEEEEGTGGEEEDNTEEESEANEEEDSGLKLNITNIDNEKVMKYNKLMEYLVDDDIMSVMGMIEEDPSLLQVADNNHWTVLHEAIRLGDTELVDYLINKGADIRQKVRGGGDAVMIATVTLPKDHPVIRLLEAKIKK